MGPAALPACGSGGVRRRGWRNRREGRSRPPVRGCGWWRARGRGATWMPPWGRSRCTVGGLRRRRKGRPAMAAPCRIRPAQPADVAAVAAIERVVFSDPWSVNDFRECLAAETPFLVALRGQKVAGYAVAHFAADEGEVLNRGVAIAQWRAEVR